MNPLLSSHSDDQSDQSDPHGLTSWAASRGLAPHTVLALASSILPAITGSTFRFNLPAASLGAPGINLAGLESDSFLSMAIADLTSPLATIQGGLVSKSREFSTGEVEAAMYLSRPVQHRQDVLERLGNPSPISFGIHDHSSESRMEKDMEVTDQAISYERLVRPHFMFIGKLPSNLTVALGQCHEGRGFAAGCVEALPAGRTQRHRRVTEIIDHLNGVSFTRKSGKIEINGSQQTVFLRGSFLFSASDFNWLVAERRDLLTHALPVTSSVTANDDSNEVDEIQAAQFMRLFNTMARRLLAHRRGHSSVNAMFRTEEAATEFLREQRAYLRELQEVPESCRVAEAAKLPSTMAWTLLMLAGKADLDAYIIKTVFAAARRLHADAIRIFREHDLADLAAQRLAVARKLVKRLTKLGPLKRRDLLRGLDQQSLHLHEPVISVLIEMGIFSETPARVLEIGLTPLANLSAKHLIEIDK